MSDFHSIESLQNMPAKFARAASVGICTSTDDGARLARLLMANDMLRSLKAATVLRCARAAGLHGHSKAVEAADALALQSFPPPAETVETAPPAPGVYRLAPLEAAE